MSGAQHRPPPIGSTEVPWAASPTWQQFELHRRDLRPDDPHADDGIERDAAADRQHAAMVRRGEMETVTHDAHAAEVVRATGSAWRRRSSGIGNGRGLKARDDTDHHLSGRCRRRNGIVVGSSRRCAGTAFGDGYIQQSADGSTRFRTFTVMAKNITPAQAAEINAFMHAKGQVMLDRPRRNDAAVHLPEVGC